MANVLAMRFSRALRDDRLLRVPLALAFAALGLAQANRLYFLAMDRLPQQVVSKTLAMAASSSNLLFVMFLASLTIFRGIPKKTAEGWVPRLYAFWGTFASLLVSALPVADVPDAVRLFSIVLVIVGAVLSLLTVRWLGRSFSIVAQSRHLVTGGPYSIVRHPLYLCEEIVMIGIMLDHLSWTTVIIVSGQWYCQLQRMKYEERVLRATFPEYEAYSRRTPAVLPALWVKKPRRPEPQS